MNRLQTLLLLLAIGLLGGCKNKPRNMENETLVRLETSMGNITVKLYDDTPRHRDNFLKLVRAGVYDNCIFHRVIKDFMVQTGDPTMLKSGTPLPSDTAQFNYTLPAEIVYPRHFNKSGALAAARMPDSVNPDKASSGTQFYIVTGSVFTPGELVDLQADIFRERVDSLTEQLSRDKMKELYLLRKSGKKEEYQALKDALEAEAERQLSQNPPAPFTEAQKRAYTTLGGAPHLDGEYTVFGEVVEGLDVAKAISKVRVKRERPLQEVYLKSAHVLE